MDRDGDDVNNIDEYRGKPGTLYKGSNPQKPDTDLDGLLDGQEFAAGTNASTWDSDRDGMHDAWEVRYGLDPQVDDARLDPDNDGPDFNGDGIPDALWPNIAEYRYPLKDWNDATAGERRGTTDPLNPDSNGDGISDGAAAFDDPNDPDHDADDDGLQNPDEMGMGTQFGVVDTDGDGVCDGGRGFSCRSWLSSQNAPGEVIDYGSNPNSQDSDGDGIQDRDEVRLADPHGIGSTLDSDNDGLNNLVDIDSDDDYLTDGEEYYTHGTDLTKVDHDNDGLTDYEELVDLVAWGMHLNATDFDSDDDGLFDGDEVLTWYTDPNNPDTDADGLSDADEIARHTNPFSPDTDKDRMPDGWEVNNSLDPLVDDSRNDDDHDAGALGLTNYQEYLLGTNPHDTDSEIGVTNPITVEGDGIDDYIEYLLGLNPTQNDAAIDTDDDDLPNLGEALLGTSPYKADTDGDRLNDGWEVGVSDEYTDVTNATIYQLGLFRTDPNEYDTDFDGLDDGDELDMWATIGANAWTTDYDNDTPVDPLHIALGIVSHFSHNLRDADSDGDGFDDGQEWLIFRTRPDLADTDGDGDSDFQEVMALVTDPLDPTSNRTTSLNAPNGTDTDGDRLTDDAEATYGTNPLDTDTDDDLLNDGMERIAWGAEWNVAYDMDGKVTNLNDTDADDDGLNDGIEFASSGLRRDRFYITSPRLNDTDGDGLSDTQEDTNGLAGETAAQGRSEPLPAIAGPTGIAWWDGIDALGPYVNGAYGVKLWGVGHSSTAQSSSPSCSSNAPSASRQSGCNPAPDKKDTDRDRLKDGAELNKYDTDWNNPDSEQDGLTDYVEIFQFTQPWVADTDGDGIPDDEEARRLQTAPNATAAETCDPTTQGQWMAGMPLPADADCDDDGILDANEKGRNLQSTDPLEPDSDFDGLPDGLEIGLPAPEGGGIYTNTARQLTCGGNPIGRTTWKAWQGAPGLLTLSALDADTDGDGIPDGVEDANGDGIVDAGELDPNNEDVDDDDLSDGLELRIWKINNICELITRRGTDFTTITSYNSANRLATDPRNNDTDDDGYLDRLDLHPRGVPMIGIDLGVYQQLRTIDGWASQWCGGHPLYAPELEFTIKVSTAIGNATVKTPILPEICAYQPVNLTNTLGGEDDLRRYGYLGALSPLRFAGSVLWMPLPQDVTVPQTTTTPDGDMFNVDQVHITIHAADSDDCGCNPAEDEIDGSDVIDLSGVSDPPTETDIKKPYSIGTSLQEAVASLDGDGGADRRGNLGDDDAKLTARFLTQVPLQFAARGLNNLPKSYLGPETEKTNYGFD